MKITDVRALHLRLDEVAETADSTQDVLLVEIDTDAGITRIGEVSSCSYVCRAIIEAPRSARRRHGLREILLDRDPLDVTANWRLIYHETERYGRGGITMNTMSAIDLALWDIRGKALGQPVHALLGGARRESVPRTRSRAAAFRAAAVALPGS